MTGWSPMSPTSDGSLERMGVPIYHSRYEELPREMFFSGAFRDGFTCYFFDRSRVINVYSAIGSGCPVQEGQFWEKSVHIRSATG